MNSSIGMQRIRLSGGTSLLIALTGLIPCQAMAATTTIGGLVASLSSNIWQPFWLLLLAVGFLYGLYSIALGLSKLRDLGGHNDRGAALDGILRIVGGALLVGLPDCINAGVGTFYNSVMGYTTTSQVSVGGVSDCIDQATGDALTCVAQNIVSNMVPVVTEVSFCLFYLCGATMIAHSLYTMANSHSTGHHQMPKGWMWRLIIGCLICNMPSLMNAISDTMGISNGTIMATGFDQNSTNLLYTADGSVTILAEYSALIADVFKILVMFGVLYVWKGVSLLRAFAEGTERGGMGPGITHIVGGVLLTNMKWTVCIVMNTFVGAAAGFCN